MLLAASSAFSSTNTLRLKVKYGHGRRFGKFVLNVTVCYILGYGLAKPLALKALAGQSVNAQENIAMLIGMCLYTGFNYLGQKFFAFKKK